jgi:hypothetical protein
MSKITESTNFANVKPEDVPLYVARWAEDVTNKVNGGLDFATNFSGQTISIAFATANADTTAAHTLSRVPAGYIVIGATAAMDIYDGSIANTTSAITLRSGAIGTARLLIY